MPVNLARKYSDKVDERFDRASQALQAASNTYDFTGVNTVKVFSIPTAPMNDYSRTGAGRYGSPSELQNSVQDLLLTKDRSFTFTIDRGNKIQSQMVMDAGKALSRQIREVVIPEFDTHFFNKLAATSVNKTNVDYTAAAYNTAYKLFLAGQEALGDANVPDSGRIVFCSYAYANLLKQDTAFMKYSDLSQEMILKGVIGEIDGVKIVKVPKSRLPIGCSFILTHPIASVAPKQLEDYKIHDNPPGISGWLVEGRIIYDAFVLDEKAAAVYTHFGLGDLRPLTVTSVADAGGATNATIVTITETKAFTEHKIVYKLGTTATDVTWGTDLSSWTTLPADGKIAASTNTLVQVAEVNAADEAIGLGEAVLVKKG
jgi:hypothetical protein